jgi:hypothetical protein
MEFLPSIAIGLNHLRGIGIYALIAINLNPLSEIELFNYSYWP